MPSILERWGVVAKDPDVVTPPPNPVNVQDRIGALQAAISVAQNSVSENEGTPRRVDPSIVGRVSLPVAEAQVRFATEPESLISSVSELPAAVEHKVPAFTTDLSVPSVEIIKPENVEVHPEIKIDGMNFSVKNFLSEVYDVMRMGRELDVLIAQREAQIAKGNGRKEEILDIKAQADSIKKSMEVFANLAKGDVASGKKLEEALVAYDTFLDTFATELQDEESKLRSEANKTILTINTMKGKLSKLMNNPNGIKSPEDFEQIKKRFRKLNAMRAGQNYPERINKVVAILEDRNDPTHAPIFKDAMQRNDIISVLQLVFGDKQPTI